MTSGYRFPRGLCYRCFVSLALLLSERLLCKCSGTLHACLSLSTIKKSLRHVRQNPQCVPVHDIIYLFCAHEEICPFSKCSHPLASLSATKSIKTLRIGQDFSSSARRAFQSFGKYACCLSPSSVSCHCPRCPPQPQAWASRS